MPNNRTISDKALTVGALVLVRGNIQYSRLVNKIEGQELELDKQRKISMGMQPIDKPYTTVTLTNARIVPIHPESGMTTEEKFVEERFYQSNNGDPAMKYTVNNKSPYPNQFYQSDGTDPKHGTGFVPEAELDNGLDVVLIMRVFQSKQFNRKSLTLQSIIVQEPVRYYSGSNQAALKEAGIVLESSPEQAVVREAARASRAEAAPSDEDEFTSEPPVSANPLPMSGAMNAPETNDAWICPNCGSSVPAGQKFCGNCGTPKPVAAANPYANPGGIGTQSGGIHYDANDQNRNY